jgi:hypothetical protein
MQSSVVPGLQLSGEGVSQDLAVWGHVWNCQLAAEQSTTVGSQTFCYCSKWI